MKAIHFRYLSAAMVLCVTLAGCTNTPAPAPSLAPQSTPAMAQTATPIQTPQVKPEETPQTTTSQTPAPTSTPVVGEVLLTLETKVDSVSLVTMTDGKTVLGYDPYAFAYEQDGKWGIMDELGNILTPAYAQYVAAFGAGEYMLYSDSDKGYDLYHFGRTTPCVGDPKARLAQVMSDSPYLPASDAKAPVTADGFSAVTQDGITRIVRAFSPTRTTEGKISDVLNSDRYHLGRIAYATLELGEDVPAALMVQSGGDVLFYALNGSQARYLGIVQGVDAVYTSGQEASINFYRNNEAYGHGVLRASIENGALVTSLALSADVVQNKENAQYETYCTYEGTQVTSIQFDQLLATLCNPDAEITFDPVAPK